MNRGFAGMRGRHSMTDYRKCPNYLAVNSDKVDICKTCSLYFEEMTRKSIRFEQNRYLRTAKKCSPFQASEKSPPDLPVAGKPPPSPCSILDLPPPAPFKASDLSPSVLKEMAVYQASPRTSKGVMHNSLPVNCMPEVFFTDQLKISENEEELVDADEKIL
jgi:hypothetical protein